MTTSLAPTEAPGLIADIGGTHVRFALVYPGETEPRDPLVLRCADYPSPNTAAEAYLTAVAPPVRPGRGAFAVASPVTGDVVDLTNYTWHFSIDDVRRILSFDRLEVVNDFTALALAIPHLTADDFTKLGGGAPVADTPIGIVGPGTGLGVSALVPTPDGGWVALATEGGHVTMAARTAREFAVLQWLDKQFDHVSAERVLSGPGLVNLYTALAAVNNRTPAYSSPDAISTRALDGTCPICGEALDMFFAMLGTVAGNLALSLGARGGIVIAGGIVPRLADAFAASQFRRRFEDKGRFKDYLAAIPCSLLTHPYPAFAGLTGLIRKS